MSSTLHSSASIDQAAVLTFENEFQSLVQQKISRLGSSAAVNFVPSSGLAYNTRRIGRQTLVEVQSSNPEKQYTDAVYDNRQFTKKRLTRTVVVDNKDINEFIADPTSSLMNELIHAVNRHQDRVIAQSAGGAVLIGAPNTAPTSVSAANDGVLTIDETSGSVDFDTIQAVTENFINNEWDMEELRGTLLALTGKEHRSLMGDTKFTSSDFIGGRPVEEGALQRAGLYEVQAFAGSVNGGIQVAQPVLSEVTSGTERENLVLAPGAIDLAAEINSMSVDKSTKHVNSVEITVDFWIGGMRREGARVQKIKTTV